jgi:hypothetical protein
VVVGIGVRRRGEELGREPQEALGLVCFHQLVHDGLEVGEDFDFRDRFRFGQSHGADVVAGQRRRGSRRPGTDAAFRRKLA